MRFREIYPWTTDELETVRVQWMDGRTALDISRMLTAAKDSGPGPSRSAVMGKVRTMGLQGYRRISTVRGRPASLPAKKPIPEKPARVDREPKVYDGPLVFEDGSKVTLLNVNDRMCRWPIGDPCDADFHLCGRAPAPGSRYCEPHADLGRDAAGTKRYRERVAEARSAVRRA